MGDDNNGVLSDHERYGTKFVLPFVDNFGDTLSYVEWQYKTLPDVLWIGLLLDSHTPRRTVEILNSISQEAAGIGDKSTYLLMSSFDSLNEDQLDSLSDDLDDGILEDLNLALAPMKYHYPDFPLAQIIDSPEGDEDTLLEKLQKVADDCYNRRSKQGVFVQAAYVASSLEQGQLQVPRGSGFENLNDIINYPQTEGSRKAAATVRATINALIGIERESIESDWASRFWDRGFEISECYFPENRRSFEDIPDDVIEDLLALGSEFEQSIRNAAVELWDTADRSVDEIGKNAVLDGLLMRQINFATNIATSPRLWTFTLGNIIIRCMVDTQIMLAWFEKEGTSEDYEQFIEHGLGQEKLAIEHAESYAEESEEDRAEVILDGIESRKHRLEEQKYTHLISVDVGSWNMSTRDMAIDAGQKEIYDLSYSPKSDIVHGMWNSLENQNLVRCGNPLHKYHRIPNFHDSSVVPFCIVDAGNMLNRSLETWINARNADPSGIDIPDLPENARRILSQNDEEQSSS